MAKLNKLNPPIPNIVVIGGGTGSFTVLSSLKTVSDITALVNMVDDGGSTGELRDQFGVLPTGDVRQCLVALSSSNELREVFNYRFPKGSDFSGHNFGNLFLTALSNLSNGDFAEAIANASKILNIKGKVIPVTLDDRRLVIQTTDGIILKGEHNIGKMNMPSLKGATIRYDEPTKLNPAAAKAIKNANIVVIAPGDLYTSIGPTLAVKGLSESIKKTHAKVIYICNLVNKPRHTNGFKVEDYASEIERIIGSRVLDYVIYNTETPTPEVLEKYLKDKEIPVEYDYEILKKKHYTAIAGEFLSKSNILKRDINDPIKDRSLIRHDQDAICRSVMKIYWD
ncbi:MAG TPA: gluconeogenesis factor YvcK family protein [Candidatus Saccharimonadales bacterium]|jgi:uncharacterized cofD-like protein|nr:gluconeogenesis factor YvcK family protein [Candidatus Saccharimonadales bacterium]